MKKTIFLLTLLLCFLFASPLSAGEVFYDVNQNDWFYKEVSDAYNNGFVSGKSPTGFDPEGFMTRGEFVTILGRIADVDKSAYTRSYFYDVDINKFYGPYVTWAYENNIVSGMGQGRFEPYTNITREQIAKILDGYIIAQGYQIPASPNAPAFFRDSHKISYWAQSSMEAMRHYGIISGDEYGNCDPLDNSTRAQGAAMLQRFYNKIRNCERQPLPLTKFTIPTDEQIKNHKNPTNSRSPYLYGWLDTGSNTRFTEYSIDFKADYLPRGTYCCLGQWTMDTTELAKTHTNIRTEYGGISAYAGFQSTVTPLGKASIMSFWDLYATDPYGRNITLRPKIIYPENYSNSNSFTGEGTGAQCINKYNWKEGRWYRMLIQCNNDGPTTLVEQWVCDLKTGTWTKLCVYDTLLPKSCFVGDVAMFLENYIPSLNAEIRSLEVKNVRYLDAATGQWKAVTNCYMGSQKSSSIGTITYDGSYEFGATSDRFWMITGGVGGDWNNNGKGQGAKTYTVTQYETGEPYPN